MVTLLFFFFQAEDGIRDPLVTGVQTCALPISLGHDVAVSGLAGREVANDVKTLGGGPEIGVGEGVAVGYAEVGACHLDDDDADLLFARGDLGGGEVAGGHVVLVPEAQVDDLVTREQLPYLGSENPEVCARVGGG